MYRIKDAKSNRFIEDAMNPVFLKQQQLVDRPTSPVGLFLKDADGIILSDGSWVGISGRNMQNYEPLVIVEEISGEPYIMQQLAAVQAQVNAMQAQSTTTGEQIAEMYAVQTGDIVVKSDLDAAYQEGVNSL